MTLFKTWNCTLPQIYWLKNCLNPLDEFVFGRRFKTEIYFVEMQLSPMMWFFSSTKTTWSFLKTSFQKSSVCISLIPEASMGWVIGHVSASLVWKLPKPLEPILSLLSSSLCSTIPSATMTGVNLTMVTWCSIDQLAFRKAFQVRSCSVGIALPCLFK